jgi:hypothetical protein
MQNSQLMWQTKIINQTLNHKTSFIASINDIYSISIVNKVALDCKIAFQLMAHLKKEKHNMLVTSTYSIHHHNLNL